MNSINPDVNALHAAFCAAVGYDVPMTMAFERWFMVAHDMGIDPEGLAMCVRERKRLNAQGGYQRGLFLRHFLRDEEDLANTVEEIAALRAKLRIKVLDPAKVSVLAAVGRPATLAQGEAVRVGAIPLIDALRKAAQ